MRSPTRRSWPSKKTALPWDGQRRLLRLRRREPREATQAGSKECGRARANQAAAQTERERRFQGHRDIWYQPGATSRLKISVFSVAWARISPTRKSEPAIQTVVVSGSAMAIRRASAGEGGVPT